MKKKGTGRGIKGIVSVCLLFAIALPLFCGCAPKDTQGKKELWIVTEKSTWSRMNGQLHVLEKAYETANEDVDIRVEYLPTEEQERDVYLQQLRTEILQGGGPDCYLLPTDGSLILDEPAQYTYLDVELLFSDVDLAMRNGLFYDIADLYDADDALGKEGLNTQIMDAGVVDGKRYILPLRYDMPVIFARNDALAEAGIDPAILQEDIGIIMGAVYATGNPVLAGGILYNDFSAFSDFVDYTTGNVLLEEETLISYMQAYQKLSALAGSQDAYILSKLSISSYIYDSYDKPTMVVENPEDIKIVDGTVIYENATECIFKYYPLWIGTMQDAFDYVPMAQYEQTDLTVVPMRSIGGGVVATVTYYAAVGSGCEDPALAYDFLRQFLLEDAQWEKNRPVRNHTKPLKGQGNTANDLQYPGLIENGWAVRDKNSLQSLWSIRKKQVYVKPAYLGEKDAQDRMRAIGLMSPLEEDRMPIFDISIDQVRFNVGMSYELGQALSQLSDPDSANAATRADIPALARKLLWTLRWFISEG